jgi:competence protein ComEA
MPDEAAPEKGERALVHLWHRVRAGEDPVAFGAVVVVLALLAGLVWFWAGSRGGAVPAASAAPQVDSPPAAEPAPPTSVPTVAVHVAGAVFKPGLYQLPSGARIFDALRAAGGNLQRADLDRLNLAAKVIDGQKILVARRGENPLPPPPGQDGPGASATTDAAEPVDLNAADLAALDSLPGIGPATAQAIIEERTRRGGFRSTRDLLRVPGIGEGRFARLKDRVRV